MLQAEHTLLDPISLALFEDTGWYIVNYTMAEELVWGKGKYIIISLEYFMFGVHLSWSSYSFAL